MKNSKLKSRVSDAAKPPPPQGLVNIDESIDEIAGKALDAARRAEERQTGKREADRNAKKVSSKL